MGIGENRANAVRQLIALLAIATALARALIPIGFMPVLVHGTAQLMFCDGGGHHHPDGAPPGDAPSGQHGSDQGPCPFALAGGAAPLPAFLPDTALPAPADEAAAAPAVAVVRDAPLRYAAPRGPPALA